MKQTLEQRIEVLENKLNISTKEEDIHVIPAKTLIWGNVSTKEMSWQEAIEWCEKQGGRLPTRIELLQAYEDKVDGFEKEYYWSATTNSSYATYAWGVSLSNGFSDDNHKTVTYNVRCVRE